MRGSSKPPSEPRTVAGEEDSLRTDRTHDSGHTDSDGRLLCLFDAGRDRFSPLSLYRPLSELRCGMFTLRSRIELLTGLQTVHIYTDPSLDHLIRVRLPGLNGEERISITSGGLRSSVPVLFLSSTLVPTPSDARRFLTEAPGTVFRRGGTIAGFVAPPLERELSAGELVDLDPAADSGRLERLIGTRVRDCDLDSILAGGVWDLIEMNERILTYDYELVREAAGGGAPIPDGVHVRDEHWILLENPVDVGPGVVIDASSGPVLIEGGARIMPFSHIRGPAFIGKGSILCAARVSGGTTIGAHCRVGGELECSLLQGYTNKVHEGFLGHSFVGEWVNLGAGTTNSDLKNNYGTVRITFGQCTIDTGMIKMGALIGDHVKTGIGTLLNTGSVVGTGSSLFGGGLIPKYTPPFVWGGSGRYEAYRLDAFLETAGTVMGRRGVAFDTAVRSLIETVYQRTATEREEWLHERKT